MPDSGTGGRSAMPVLAALADAWTATPAGPLIDWVRLRGLLDWLRAHPEHAGEAIAAQPAPSGSPLLDALLAGIADKVADDHPGLSRPTWAATVTALAQPWTPPGTPRRVAAARAATPPQLAARNIWLAAGDLWRQPTAQAAPPAAGGAGPAVVWAVWDAGDLRSVHASQDGALRRRAEVVREAAAQDPGAAELVERSVKVRPITVEA